MESETNKTYKGYEKSTFDNFLLGWIIFQLYHYSEVNNYFSMNHVETEKVQNTIGMFGIY